MRKSLRFEVFARDGFTCQYCGVQPPDIILEVDHIHPVSKGGEDDLMNLITSCYACNRGKGSRIIAAVAPRPDANLALLRAQQEIAETRQYLETKVKRDRMFKKAAVVLRDAWFEFLTPEVAPSSAVLVPWINKFGAAEVEKAIMITASSFPRNKFRSSSDDHLCNKMVPYVAAVLRNRQASVTETAVA